MFRRAFRLRLANRPSTRTSGIAMPKKATITGPATSDVATASAAMATSRTTAKPSHAGLRRQSTPPRPRAHEREAAQRERGDAGDEEDDHLERGVWRGTPPPRIGRPSRPAGPRSRSPASRRRARSRSGAGPAAGARTGRRGRRRRPPPSRRGSRRARRRGRRSRTWRGSRGPRGRRASRSHRRRPRARPPAVGHWSPARARSGGRRRRRRRTRSRNQRDAGGRSWWTRTWSRPARIEVHAASAMSARPTGTSASEPRALPGRRSAVIARPRGARPSANGRPSRTAWRRTPATGRARASRLACGPA